jgi:N utilization substance protein B
MAEEQDVNTTKPRPRIISDWEDDEHTKIDRRHLQRMALVQALFIDEFPGQSWSDFAVDYNQETLDALRSAKAEYDQQIQAVATERPLAELAKTDLAILRLILHESKTKNTPLKVLIDEGVELAKDFGGEHSYAFINAVLEKLLLPKPAEEKSSEVKGTP